MTAPRERFDPADRGEQIIEAALVVACRNGLDALCTRAVAERLGVARSLVSHYYSMGTLRDLVVMRAASVGCVRVVAQAIAGDETMAPRIEDRMYNRAIGYLLGGKQCPERCKANTCGRSKK